MKKNFVISLLCLWLIGMFVLFSYYSYVCVVRNDRPWLGLVFGLAVMVFLCITLNGLSGPDKTLKDEESAEDA